MYTILNYIFPSSTSYITPKPLECSKITKVFFSVILAATASGVLFCGLFFGAHLWTAAVATSITLFVLLEGLDITLKILIKKKDCLANCTSTNQDIENSEEIEYQVDRSLFSQSEKIAESEDLEIDPLRMIEERKETQPKSFQLKERLLEILDNQKIIH